MFFFLQLKKEERNSISCFGNVKNCKINNKNYDNSNDDDSDDYSDNNDDSNNNNK